MNMLYINGSRGSGKTAALIGAFKVNPFGVLVLPNKEMVKHCLSHWPELRPLVKQRRIVAAPGLSQSDWFPAIGARLYVDEVAMIRLTEYARSRVVAVTGS